MKKNQIISFILCLLLLAQVIGFPAAATETSDTGETEETTASTQSPVEETVASVTAGTDSVSTGCHSLDGQVPLAGTAQIVESAQAVFIYEVNTQTVLYAYNPDNHLYPGSLSKVLTALIAVEQGNLDDKVTFSTKWNSTLPLGARVADLKEGEELTLRDLVYCLLVESANDAALGIADYFCASEEDFVVMMNQRAQELGCKDSHFVNCHGMDNEAQYTTARDMARIVTAACQNETFMEIFGAEKYVLQPNNKVEEERKLISDNYLKEQTILPMFNDDRVTGGKTSSTSGAGTSLVCTAEDEEKTYVCVLMGATRVYNTNRTIKHYGNFEEMLELLAFAFDGYKVSNVLNEGQSLYQFPVTNGESNVVGGSGVQLHVLVPKDTKISTLIYQYAMKDGGISAPIQEGDQVGSMQIWYQTCCLSDVNLYALGSVRSAANSGLEIQGAASRDDSNVSSVLLFLGGVFAVVLVLLGIYLGYNWIRRSMVRSRRRRRRASRRRSR